MVSLMQGSRNQTFTALELGFKPSHPPGQVVKQRSEVHVEVAGFHIHRQQAHLALPARWPNIYQKPTYLDRWPYSEFGSPRSSGRLPHI